MCFSFAHLWQFLEALLEGGRNKAEVEWLLEKLEKLAIRRENCNEKMSLNKANTILQRLFSCSLVKTSGDFMSGFLCFPEAEPTGKELEKKMSPLSLDSGPGIQGRHGLLNYDGQENLTCTFSATPTLLLASHTVHTYSISQDRLGPAAVTTQTLNNLTHKIYISVTISISGGSTLLHSSMAVLDVGDTVTLSTSRWLLQSSPGRDAHHTHISLAKVSHKVSKPK